jgi:effector-binding domain-containing protein
MSIDKPYHTRFEAQTVARIHVVTPRQEIRSAMHAAIQEISAALKAAGVPRTGPWFAHHHRRPADTFDFDVCFPISKPLQHSGRVENAEIPAVEVLRTIHHGVYGGLPQAWQDFYDWISASGWKTREDIFEVYTVGPQDNDDPEGWKTELNSPVANDETNTQAIH